MREEGRRKRGLAAAKEGSGGHLARGVGSRRFPAAAAVLATPPAQKHRRSRRQPRRCRLPLLHTRRRLPQERPPRRPVAAPAPSQWPSPALRVEPAVFPIRSQGTRQRPPGGPRHLRPVPAVSPIRSQGIRQEPSVMRPPRRRSSISGCCQEFHHTHCFPTEVVAACSHAQVSSPASPLCVPVSPCHTRMQSASHHICE